MHAVTLEAEQSVLSCVMQDPQSIDKVGALKWQHFGHSAHQTIWKTLTRLVMACKATSPVSLAAAMTDAELAEVGGVEYLQAIESCVPTARHASRYAEIVRDRAHQRGLLAVADQITEIARSDETVDAKLDAISGALSSSDLRDGGRVPRTLSEVAMARVDHYERLQRGEVATGWPTGLPALDSMLTGGLRPGKVYVLAARPSVGKSSLSQQICMRMARLGHPTMFLSQEMSSEELADRAVASSGRLDYGAIQTGRMTEDDWHKAVDALEDIGSLPFYVDDQGSLSLADIKAKARSIKGLKVLCLDYIQLCAGSRKDGNRNAELEEISRGLKALSKELDIAIIVLSQLNREVEKRATKRPQASDLRDSGAIEQDADVIMFLWPVRDLGEQRIVGLSVEKNRSGRRGAFGIAFFGATQEWHESTADISEQQSRAPVRGGGFE